MSIISGRASYIKLTIVFFVAAILAGVTLLGDGQKVIASASGPSPSHTNAPGEGNCTACHTDFPINSGIGGVRISGIPQVYMPGQQIPVTVTTSQEDAVIYGFQLTAIDVAGRMAGTFTLPDQNPPTIQLMDGNVNGDTRQYVEHTSDGLFTPGVFGSNSWSFIWTAPIERSGPIGFYVAGNAANSDGGTSGDYIYTDTAVILPASALYDFDGDLKCDIALFRPSAGAWYLEQSTAGFYGVSFGASTDKIVPADYDGDGKSDIAVYRPSTGIWYIANSSDGTISYYGFGIDEDLPAPADYDGDGRADITVFRPSSGTWYRLNSSDGGFVAVQFGAGGDKPIVGDFDGDGKADIAIFRPPSGAWYQMNSSDGSFFGEQFGISSDNIAPADYDGDGKTDIAIYRPSEGLWYVKYSATATYTPYVFGLANDLPVPGDFDGDGNADIAVFRPADGTWYIVNSSNGSYTIYQFGQNGDRPAQSSFNQ